MRRLAVGALLILIAGACASVKPMPIRTGELCFRCRRPIIETRLAAQTVGGGLVSNFRAPGCLAKYLADHPEPSTVFVTDFASGKMVLAAAAVYVPTVDRNNGEQDYMAFSNRATAQSEATARSTSPVTWDVVLEQARQAQRGN